MTTVADVCPQVKIPETEYIRSILSFNKLMLREGRRLTRCMITAVQPLSIDGKEICSDTVLVEFIEYATADQMARETATLTIKKAAFGLFQSSMTSIPKYCFTKATGLKAVLVHSVSRITLDDILTATETTYRLPYTYDRIGYYTDWKKAVADKVRTTAPPGKGRLFAMMVKVPACIFPGPARIIQSQRRSFAESILRTVMRHHANGIHHDRISERTIFFPMMNQPQFLANYSGVVSSMLGDYLPSELLANDAGLTYGPQCRDVYSCALICYRIMTGEKRDGKEFTIESPRPPGMVLREILHQAGCTVHVKTIRAGVRSVCGIFVALKKIAALFPVLFSGSHFIGWHKINRATGGLWRSIPVIGPLGDILAPSPIAAALRNILDRSWFVSYSLRRKVLSPGDKQSSYGPEITTLVDVFKNRSQQGFPQFEAAMDMVNSESVRKRHAFGSVMESRFGNRFSSTRKKGIAFSVAVLMLMMLYLVFVYGNQSILVMIAGSKSAAMVPESARNMLPPQMKNMDEAQAASVPIKSDAIRINSEMVNVNEMPATSGIANPGVDDLTAITISEGEVETIGGISPQLSVPATIPPDKKTIVKHKNRPVVKKGTVVKKRSLNTPAVVSVTGDRRQAVTISREKVTSGTGMGLLSRTDSEATVSVPVKATGSSSGELSPVPDHHDVFMVRNQIDSCNPGKLYFMHNGHKDRVMMSRLPAAAQKLYMARRSTFGFGPIVTIRLCRTGRCDRTMYYELLGMDRVGKPVFVKSGDAISKSHLRLRRFLEDQRVAFTE